MSHIRSLSSPEHSVSDPLPGLIAARVSESLRPLATSKELDVVKDATDPHVSDFPKKFKIIESLFSKGRAFNKLCSRVDVLPRRGSKFRDDDIVRALQTSPVTSYTHSEFPEVFNFANAAHHLSLIALTATVRALVESHWQDSAALNTLDVGFVHRVSADAAPPTEKGKAHWRKCRTPTNAERALSRGGASRALQAPLCEAVCMS